MRYINLWGVYAYDIYLGGRERGGGGGEEETESETRE